MNIVVKVVLGYAAFVVVVCVLFALAYAVTEIGERLEDRRDRRRWQEIDREAKSFRAELDAFPALTVPFAVGRTISKKSAGDVAASRRVTHGGSHE